MAGRKLAINFLGFFWTKNLTLSFLFFSVTIRYFPSQEYLLYFYSLSLQLRMFVNFASLVLKNMNSEARNTAELSTAYLGETTDLVTSFHIPVSDGCCFGKG